MKVSKKKIYKKDIQNFKRKSLLEKKTLRSICKSLNFLLDFLVLISLLKPKKIIQKNCTLLKSNFFVIIT